MALKGSSALKGKSEHDSMGLPAYGDSSSNVLSAASSEALAESWGRLACRDTNSHRLPMRVTPVEVLPWVVGGNILGAGEGDE